jgi:hypothetical protein
MCRRCRERKIKNKEGSEEIFLFRLYSFFLFSPSPSLLMIERLCSDVLWHLGAFMSAMDTVAIARVSRTLWRMTTHVRRGVTYATFDGLRQVNGMMHFPRLKHVRVEEICMYQENACQHLQTLLCYPHTETLLMSFQGPEDRWYDERCQDMFMAWFNTMERLQVMQQTRLHSLVVMGTQLTRTQGKLIQHMLLLWLRTAPCLVHVRTQGIHVELNAYYLSNLWNTLAERCHTFQTDDPYFVSKQVEYGLPWLRLRALVLDNAQENLYEDDLPMFDAPQLECVSVSSYAFSWGMDAFPCTQKSSLSRLRLLVMGYCIEDEDMQKLTQSASLLNELVVREVGPAFALGARAAAVAAATAAAVRSEKPSLTEWQCLNKLTIHTLKYTQVEQLWSDWRLPATCHVEYGQGSVDTPTDVLVPPLHKIPTVTTWNDLVSSTLCRWAEKNCLEPFIFRRFDLFSLHTRGST